MNNPQQHTIQTVKTDPELERTCRGHLGSINACAFFCDNEKLVSASSDKSLMIWFFQPTMRVYRYIGHADEVLALDVNNKDSLIASASKDKCVRLWKPTIKGNSTQMKGHTAAVRDVKFSQDGKLLLTASNDKTLKVWSVTGQKFIITLKGHTNWVRSGVFSPDGNLIASGSDDKTVKLFDPRRQSYQEVVTFTEHNDSVNCVRFHPNGMCVAACSADKSINLWDTRMNGKLLQHYSAHSNNINSISFHQSGNFLLSASDDGYMKIWDLREGQLYYTISGHSGAVKYANFSKDGQYFASGGDDNLAMIWKTNFDTISPEYAFGDEKVTLVKSSANKKKPNVPPSSISQKKQPQYQPQTYFQQQQQLQQPQYEEPIPERKAANITTSSEYTFTSAADKKRPKSAINEQNNSNFNNSMKRSMQQDYIPTQQQPKRPQHNQMSYEAQNSDFEGKRKVPKKGSKPEQGPLDITPELGNTLEHIVRQLDSLTENIKRIEGKMTKIEEKADNNQKIMNQRIQKKLREESQVQDDDEDDEIETLGAQKGH